MLCFTLFFTAAIQYNAVYHDLGDIWYIDDKYRGIMGIAQYYWQSMHHRKK